MKTYTLLNKHGFYESNKKGLFGGHKGEKIYGRMNCSTALRAIAKGKYIKNRVFFATETDAIEAGYRPCGNCMREEYRSWKMLLNLDKNRVL